MGWPISTAPDVSGSRIDALTTPAGGAAAVGTEDRAATFGEPPGPGEGPGFAVEGFEQARDDRPHPARSQRIAQG
jgi:hypothetical protein